MKKKTYNEKKKLSLFADLTCRKLFKKYIKSSRSSRGVWKIFRTQKSVVFLYINNPKTMNLKIKQFHLH
jgi:hypothetical protein